MASGTFYPAASGDDGFSHPSIAFYYFVDTEDYIYIGNWNSYYIKSWFRFQNVTIPQGATITSCYVRFRAAENLSFDTVRTKIYFEDVDDSTAPTSKTDLESRSLTSSIDWDFTTNWTTNSYYNTISLTSILQEVIDRPGFSSGNSVTVHIRNDGTSYDAKRSARSYDYSGGSSKAELHVEWETGVTIPAVNDAASAISIDNLVLTQKHTLAVQDLSLALGLEGPLTLTLPTAEAEDMSLGISIDNVVLTQKHTLAVQDLSLALGLEGPLTLPFPTAEAEDMSLGISIDNVVLTQKHTLAVQDISLGLGAEGPVDLELGPLNVQDALLALSIDNIDLTQKHTLVVNPMSVSLDVANVVTIQDYGTEDERAIKLYTLTLTGAEDGETDLTLPISSFQGRMKSGEASYLSAVVPTLDYLDEINLRTNGDIFITLKYEINGVVTHSEEIARANFNTLRWDKGGVNQSITLSGYKTTTFTNKGVELRPSNVTYQGLYGDGRSVFRFPTPDLDLRPGDTAKIGTDTIVVGNISYSVSTTNQTMELTEA
jgi:hypothetical protein